MVASYQQSFDKVLAQFSSSERGLDQAQATEQLEAVGPNSIIQQDGVSAWQIVLAQFSGFLVWLLMGAGLVSFVIGEEIDAYAILVIVIVNAVLGFVQEFKAEKAIEALRSMQTASATVLRDGKEISLDAASIVPGDVVLLQEGDKIPADLRLFTVAQLDIDESILTGESLPVTKQVESIDTESVLGDQTNMAFSGTIVTRGHGRGVVVATGMLSELGKIAAEVQQEEKKPTPLQIAMNKIGQLLGISAIALTVPGALIGLYRGNDPFEMFMTAIALAVAAIPEGLPVVVTLTLALGTKRMLQKKALVRRLPIVETLGSATVICTDKTGTITKNQMTITDIATAGRDGAIISTVWQEGNAKSALLDELTSTAVYCNEATLEHGDPTEIALIRFAAAYDFALFEQVKRAKRLDEIPFTSDAKFMATLVEVGGHYSIHIKGAAEVILAKCTSIATETGQRALTDGDRAGIEDAIQNFASRALRVLGLAYRPSESHKMGEPSNFTFLGLVALKDPPRAAVPAALQDCFAAGVRVIMITGDHPVTAEAIAREVGFPRSAAISGAQLSAFSEAEFADIVRTHDVFARVSSDHKRRILASLQSDGQIVAMTGDGVNDAAAIKGADIGIAVGSGTDLAKEVADMILLDDNFATIRSAIAEGRHIFGNIKKFLRFLISANLGEVLIVFFSILLGLPLVLMPIQILWVNLATDSLPALALTTDQGDSDSMQRPPVHPARDIFRGMGWFLTVVAITSVLSVIGIFLLAQARTNDLALSRTMAFTTLVFFELFIVYSARSERSAFAPGIFSNRELNGSVILGVVMQLLIIYSPLGHFILHTVPLSFIELSMTVLFASLGFVSIETFRYLSSFKSKLTA